MYAVVKIGGHQYKVQEGDKLKVDRMAGESGDKVTFSDVLLLSDAGQTSFGESLENANVEAEITEQKRHDKVIVFKYKRRKNYKKTTGQKQPYTTVEIKKIHK